MTFRYLVPYFCVLLFKLTASQSSCPRAKLVQRGTCTTQCVPSDGCTEANSMCVCDGRCGFSCLRKDLSCGSPPRVRNAIAKQSGTNFNDTVTYTCRKSFTINGSPKKRCTAKGKWDGVGPTCLPVCTNPVLPFGVYIQGTIKRKYNTGENIILGCKKGYKKLGNPRRICISGRWTAFPFQCKATRFCQRTIRYARTRCTTNCSPQDASGCPAGHMCLCDGQCGYSCVETGLSCGPPEPVSYGFMNTSTFSYNATVRYWCKDGFTLNGDAVKRCTAKKRWEGTASCLPDCGQPKIPRNAFIENNKTKYASGDRVTFRCKENFNQEGIATTLCFMGKWNVMPFRCENMVVDAELESVTASAEHQREEELQVFWSYIVGMLTNLESLPLERIHSMLRMFAMQGPASTQCSVEDLRRFLDRKVREQELQFVNGFYRLPKTGR